jgi:hypothetical protein
MRSRLALAAGALALLLLAIASGAGAQGRYTDATGDGNGAPDIQGVTVSGDRSGNVTFQATVDNIPDPPAPTWFWIYLDTDLNEQTGAPDTLGADYGFQIDFAARQYAFAHWNGSAWDDSTPRTTVQVSASATTITISVNRSELGNTSEFNFWAETLNGDPASSSQFDDAPNDGNWNFSLPANGPNITGALLTTKPAAGPVHGKAFAVHAALRVPNDPGLPPGVHVLVVPDKYSCNAKLAGRTLRGRGTGKCTWTIPKKKSTCDAQACIRCCRSWICPSSVHHSSGLGCCTGSQSGRFRARS